MPFLYKVWFHMYTRMGTQCVPQKLEYSAYLLVGDAAPASQKSFYDNIRHCIGAMPVFLYCSIKISFPGRNIELMSNVQLIPGIECLYKKRQLKYILIPVIQGYHHLRRIM